MENSTVSVVSSIEECKHLWLHCEKEKEELRNAMAAIVDKQRLATKKIYAYMIKNENRLWRKENEIQKLNGDLEWNSWDPLISVSDDLAYIHVAEILSTTVKMYKAALKEVGVHVPN
jgi:hypothetical protein